ncbi:hypothetical protein HanXRQr2_Chr12g0553531 [Helianthus annuus]|uniref:Uncharacterized protein n=1 Tax=Helianthus annuus TaxID=4232 RepID=A0A9K3MXI6_HELAN|nr:hypothetical protein HanXRQr2_Chr12g0553531 [Helianthus annuus]KAJ0863678.1 hypothetical protein HanPSC8_Chr12g0532851 [Helianthus annuus]
MWSRVLSRRSISRSLSYLLPMCNEDTGPVMPALIYRGVTVRVNRARLPGKVRSCVSV